MQYDKFQKESIEYIDQGYSVIVSAPTGAGKTVIAEYVINKCLAQQEKVIYTAPIKALSNQKFRDFQSQYPDLVGILTGDVTINAQAPVLIMTTEIFRNKVLEDSNLLENYQWIIFDEIHYLDDVERGTVWEESIIFLPPHIRILALSATIPNIDELAKWINNIHQIELKVVKEDKRPVPLHFNFNINGKIVNSFENLKASYFLKKQFLYKKEEAFEHISKISSLVEHMHNENKLPCIFFSFNRRRCEALSDMLLEYNFLSKEEQVQIMQTFNALCNKFGITDNEGAKSMFPLIQRGIAYHHAGMLPTLKEVIERLFTSGLLKIIFTTETFALGINMPARSVVFDELKKNYGMTWNAIKTRDFYQMAGRAGRRGQDEAGYIWCRINPQRIKWDEVKRIITGQPEKVVSQLNNSYATLLHLYNDLSEDLYDIYPRSFHYSQSDKKERKRMLNQMKSKIGILKNFEHIKHNKLTPKGLFASQFYGYELILSELFANGFIEKLNKYELGVLILSLVYEPRRNNTKPVYVPKCYRFIEKTVEKESNKVRMFEKYININPLSKEPFFGLSYTLESWMKNEKFEKIMKYTESDEGEIVRYFRMTMQILKEFQSSKLVSEKLSYTAYEAFKCINRGVIDAEKQLRTI